MILFVCVIATLLLLLTTPILRKFIISAYSQPFYQFKSAQILVESPPRINLYITEQTLGDESFYNSAYLSNVVILLAEILLVSDLKSSGYLRSKSLSLA